MTNQFVLAQQRHAKARTQFPERNSLSHAVVRIGGGVVNVDDPALERHSADDAAAVCAVKFRPFARQKRTEFGQ
jgi:hypothetical protein